MRGGIGAALGAGGTGKAIGRNAAEGICGAASVSGSPGGGGQVLCRHLAFGEGRPVHRAGVVDPHAQQAARAAGTASAALRVTPPPRRVREALSPRLWAVLVSSWAA